MEPVAPKSTHTSKPGGRKAPATPTIVQATAPAKGIARLRRCANSRRCSSKLRGMFIGFVFAWLGPSSSLVTLSFCVKSFEQLLIRGGEIVQKLSSRLKSIRIRSEALTQVLGGRVIEE